MAQNAIEKSFNESGVDNLLPNGSLHTFLPPSNARLSHGLLALALPSAPQPVAFLLPQAEVRVHAAQHLGLALRADQGSHARVHVVQARGRPEQLLAHGLLPDRVAKVPAFTGLLRG